MDRKTLERRLFTTALIVLGVFVVFGLMMYRGGLGGRRTLSLTHFLGESLDRKTLASLIREFEDRNPRIRIRLDRDGAADKTGGPGFSAGIVIFDEGRINAFVRQGLLAALNPYMEPEEGGRSGPAADQYALPLVSFMDLLFYNVDLLRAAGFDRPPKTRAEFLACARAAAAEKTGGSKVFGTALAFSPGDPLSIRRDFFSWAWAAGAALIRGGKPDFSSPPVRETLEFLQQLHAEGLLSPGSFEKTGAEKVEEFAAGKIAMMIGSVEDLPSVRKRMDDAAFGITLIPATAEYAGRPVLGPSRWYAGISSRCAAPDEAWAFLSFLAEKSPFLAAQVRAAPGGGGPGDEIREDDVYAKAWDIYEAAELIHEFSGFPGGDELENIIREELALLFEGKKNAAETSAAIQKRGEAL